MTYQVKFFNVKGELVGQFAIKDAESLYDAIDKILEASIHSMEMSFPVDAVRMEVILDNA